MIFHQFTFVFTRFLKKNLERDSNTTNKKEKKNIHRSRRFKNRQVPLDHEVFQLNIMKFRLPIKPIRDLVPNFLNQLRQSERFVVEGAVVPLFPKAPKNGCS